MKKEFKEHINKYYKIYCGVYIFILSIYIIYSLFELNQNEKNKIIKAEILTAEKCISICSPLSVKNYVYGYNIITDVSGQQNICSNEKCGNYEIACSCSDLSSNIDYE